MNDLQKKLAEMLEWFSKYLEKNNLRYYIVGGTVLGAARHGGFIPWDDDIDIGMPRSDYNKLIEMLKTPVDHYVVESPYSENKDYRYGMAKLYDMNTTMTELLRCNVTRGVYIDIFPLDGMGNTPEECKRNFKKADRLNMLLAMKNCAIRKDRKWWKNLAVIIGGFLPISGKKLAQKLDKVAATYDYDDCLYVMSVLGTYREKELMEKRILGTPKRYQFEGFEVYGPEQTEEYLTHVYGDWRKLPPEDKRHSAHDLIDLDLNTPYRK